MVFSGYTGASQVALVVKNPPANAGDIKRCRFDPWVRKIPWRRAWQPTHSSILAWRIPRTEEPSRLQSIVSQRVRHHRSNLALMHAEYNKPFLLITILSPTTIEVSRYLDVGFSLCFFHFKTDNCLPLPTVVTILLSSRLGTCVGRFYLLDPRIVL